MPRLPSDDLDLPPPPSRAGWVEELKDRLPLDGRALAWVAAALVAIGVAVWLLRPAPPAVEEALPMASTTTSSVGAAASTSSPLGAGSSSLPASDPASVPTELVVHAAGAVVRPGVYTLDTTARVDDLIRAAGGLAQDADGARINLAAPLVDGARVYVPAIGETDAPVVVGPDGGTGPPTAPDGAAPGGADPDAPAAPVDLNTATEAELDELPGVGPSIAAAIVAFRTENGGFASVDDLLDVRGIGEAKLAELRPLVTV